MIFRKTWLSVADNTNINWMQVFHLYQGFHRRQTHIGFFVKGSARVVEPPRTEYKGFKFKFNKKGDICRSFLIRTTKPLNQIDGSVLYFKTNNCVLIRKKQDLKSKYLFGPIPAGVKRKKFKTLFKTVL
jgi:ribosomal protein L14